MLQDAFTRLRMEIEMEITKSLSENLMVDQNSFINYVKTAPFRYKKYSIRKRNGTDYRQIAQPSKAVKMLQRQAISILREHLIVHESAFAYEKGKGIRDNAQAHVHNQYLLKMDFENFFHSITPEIFLHIAAAQGVVFCENDVHTLQHLLFYKLRRNSPLRLSIGAPSSPFISNTVMYFFDKEITQTCGKLGVKYTRYADDLTFSTNTKDLLVKLPKIVEKALLRHFNDSIKINSDKTILSSKAFNRHVTGITITNDNKLSLGRSKKRLISAMIHRFTLDTLSQEDTLKLHGFIGFALHVEPVFVARMAKKYGSETIDAIRKAK